MLQIPLSHPCCDSGTLMGDAAVMLSVYPEFSQAVISSFTTRGEFVFLLDRSGSMEGARIGSARVIKKHTLLCGPFFQRELAMLSIYTPSRFSVPNRTVANQTVPYPLSGNVVFIHSVLPPYSFLHP